MEEGTTKTSAGQGDLLMECDEEETEAGQDGGQELHVLDHL